MTVSIGDPDSASVFTYDYAGRLWTAYLDGMSYRRALDGRILARWRPPHDERQRKWLAPSECQNLEEQALRHIAALNEAIENNIFDLSAPLPQQGQVGFQRALAFDSQADVKRYWDIYKPIGILPPDQYLSVVLQATEGCSFNTCTFCSFYKDRPFRIKSPDEFLTHTEAVREFLGEGLKMRRSIFLGDANALVIPISRLLPLFDIVHDVFNMGNIFAFLDGFSGEKKSVQDYAELAQRGLKRVYVGLESGNAGLLNFLQKPGKPEDAINAVQAMKEGGVAAGVIVLIGAGGREYASTHVRDTIDVINAMQLETDDMIYFSELIATEELEYAQDAQQAKLQPLTQEERTAQQEAIRVGLHFRKPDKKPRISRYDIREFVY